MPWDKRMTSQFMEDGPGALIKDLGKEIGFYIAFESTSFFKEIFRQ